VRFWKPAGTPEKVKHAMPAMVRIASDRTANMDSPATRSQSSVRTKPPGGRNSKKSA
jgi:hypothetical protein